MPTGPEKPARTTARLLEWYEANRRDLPWRGRLDSYEIWVSEVMLQQTRSETVERYYEPFLRRFPTVRDLASAAEEEVLAAWSGLGYYRRARQLHAAARRVESAGGEVPTSLAELRRLPGIGSYTAAAIASMAFGVPEPVLDGNVERVLSRYIALDVEPRRAAGRRRLEEVARGLLDSGRPGDSNQALMELGALVCSPRQPRCGECPLAPGCAARRLGEQHLYPRSPARPATVKESWIAVVVLEDGEVLLAQRPKHARLMAGMWELPSVESTAASFEASLAARYGGTWHLAAASGSVKHSITTRSLDVAVHRGRWEPDQVAAASPLRWISVADLAATPTSSLVQKALAVAVGGR